MWPYFTVPLEGHTQDRFECIFNRYILTLCWPSWHPSWKKKEIKYTIHCDRTYDSYWFYNNWFNWKIFLLLIDNFNVDTIYLNIYLQYSTTVIYIYIVKITKGNFFKLNKCGHRNVLSKRQVWMSILYNYGPRKRWISKIVNPTRIISPRALARLK